MNEEERKIVKKFERLYLKDFNNEKITNEDRLSYIECALITNLIEKLQKENEKLNEKILDNAGIYQLGFKDGEESYIKKVKDKIEEIQIEYNKLDKEVDEYINDTNKDLSKYYENKEKIGEMQTLSWCIDNLQELLVSN